MLPTGGIANFIKLDGDYGVYHSTFKYYKLPGLVNVNKKLWKDPPFFMAKSTISMAMFNSFLYPGRVASFMKIVSQNLAVVKPIVNHPQILVLKMPSLWLGLPS
jgi:hypothetical protein